MKKTLFLTLVMSIMLLCFFAISVGAVTGSDSSEYGEVTYVEGISEVNGYDTTSRAVVQNADGTYTTYPAYYVFNGSTGTNMKVSFSKLNDATGENYTTDSLIRVEVFENSRLNWTFQNCTSLIDVYLPDSVYFHYASFTHCKSLTTIKIPSGATQIPTECFDNCVSLTSIEIPTTVKSLGSKAFQNCNSLSEIKILCILQLQNERNKNRFCRKQLVLHLYRHKRGKEKRKSNVLKCPCCNRKRRNLCTRNNFL